MVKFISTLSLIAFIVFNTFGQCPNTSTTTFCLPTPGSTLVLGVITDACDMQPGEYHNINNLVAGNTYRFSFCNPSSNNPVPTTYNSFMTVYGPSGFVTFNDDFCGTNSQVEFVAPTSGTYRVLCNVSGNCGANSPQTNTPLTVTLVNAPSSAATVSSVNRASTNPTNAASVNYTVTFSGNVSGLTAANFSLTTTGGISGASVGTPTGSGTTWTIPVNTGSGDGTIRLDMVNTTGTTPMVTTPYTSGEVYTIDKTAPTISIGSPSANAASCGSITYTISYTGASSISLANGNITLNTMGNASANVAVSGSGTSVRTVTLSNFTGTGTLGISIAANTASDAVGNNAAAAGPSATFSVSPPPSATINYNNSPYCNTGTAAVTLSGNANGTFSSSNGLSINANSGEVNLASSTPGSYVVTYIIPAAAGCPQFQTTANITITAAPSATINYNNSPYCNTGTASVTLSGNANGTFSSTNGLSINANSGEVNLNNSTAGSYIVTYTIPPAAGCPQLQTTTNVIINPAPIISVMTNAVCQGYTTTLSPATGGTWVSSNPSIASINNAGLVTGLSVGIVYFTFTETMTGCSAISANITTHT